MRKIFNVLYFILSIVVLVYLLLPRPEFPKSLSDSYQSDEPADVETTLRRGYYTHFSRGEVVKFYFENFSQRNLWGVDFKFPSIKLNYPPEDAQTLIRDQTRSTYLEEIVHPMRESLFVNGFEPKLDKDVIIKNGTIYEQKVIIRYYQSNIFVRAIVGIGSLVLFYLIINSYRNLIGEFLRLKNKS